MILSGKTIRERSIFSPFFPRVSHPGRLISYGESYAGYDIRCGYRFLVPPGISVQVSREERFVSLCHVANITLDPLKQGKTIDCGNVLENPKYASDDCPCTGLRNLSSWRYITLGKVSEDRQSSDASNYRLLLWGGVFVLAESIEYITVPKDCIGLCFGKSTYARSGVLVNVTPLEPGWHGILTIEITNLSKYNSVVIYPGHGIAQIVFGTIDCETKGYEGSWQGQKGAIVEPMAIL